VTNRISVVETLFAASLAFLALAADALAQGAPPPAPPLKLEGKIPLGSVKGRIDHMAADVARQRLFVAELGNNSLGVVDLAARSVSHIGGLKEPQGVGYVAATDTVYVANAGDGTVHLFRGEKLAPAGVIDLKSDADNVRVDAAQKQVLVGYGDGALAIVDPATNAKVADIALKAHPESFRLSDASGRIFVNLPSAHAIAVIDRASGGEAARWQTKNLSGNYAMALDEAAKHVIAVFRAPARLVVMAMSDGATVAERETCGDSDDVFLDAKRKRVYVICGAGFIDVFDAAQSYQRIARVPTVSGARTGLFSPALDLLAVAVRASGKEPAAIWLYRAAP
jgi:DNA-binding beta-propeller fold protein YncE